MIAIAGWFDWCEYVEREPAKAVAEAKKAVLAAFRKHSPHVNVKGVARELGVPMSTVRYRLNNGPVRNYSPRGCLDDKVDELVKRRDSGWSWGALGMVYGVSKSTVRRYYDDAKK